MAEKSVCEQLAEQIGAPDSTILPQIFALLTDEKEARLLLAAAPPAAVDELAEKTGLGAAEIAEMVDSLFHKGLVLKSKKPDGIRYYRVRHVLQLHDATAVATDAPRELFALWKQFMATEWDGYTRQLESVLPGAVMRVIPINTSFEPNAQVLVFDDVRSLVNGARNLAVTRCSCRAIDGACGKPLDVCLQLDRAADYAIERGTGRQITKDQATEILRECARQGLVHVSENKRSAGQVICNCCSDCCVNWASIRTGTGKLIAPSRFRAIVDPDECNGCEECISSCFFNALSPANGGAVVAVEAERCMGCGVCQVICPLDAVHLHAVRPEEFIPA
jgi:Pyruvate/2-oxoacid:ferredoxin oxidoreductase delta subunit/predicted transcriptional regulator